MKSTPSSRRGLYLYPARGSSGGAVATWRPQGDPAGIRNQEWGGHVYLCTGPAIPWVPLWPLPSHYS